MKRKLIVRKEIPFVKPYLARISDDCMKNDGSGFMSVFCWKQDEIFSARKDSLFLVLSALEVCFDSFVVTRYHETFMVVDPMGIIRILDRYTTSFKNFLTPVILEPEE